MDEIRSVLSQDIAVLQQSKNDGVGEIAGIIDCWNEQQIEEKIIESIANTNNAILEQYLEGQSISFTELENKL